MLFDIYLKAEKGDAKGLAMLSLAYDLALPKFMNWIDVTVKGGVDGDIRRDYAQEMDRSDSILGSPLSKLLLGYTKYKRIAVSIPEKFRQRQKTNVSTLMINGSIDFSTPLTNAEELLPYLENGKLVVAAEMGHVQDILTYKPESLRKLITEFYDQGIVNKSLYAGAPDPVNFKVSLSLKNTEKLPAQLRKGKLVIYSVFGSAVKSLASRVKSRKNRESGFEEAAFSSYKPANFKVSQVNKNRELEIKHLAKPAIGKRQSKIGSYL